MSINITSKLIFFFDNSMNLLKGTQLQPDSEA
jgi:hypothetical protein